MKTLSLSVHELSTLSMAIDYVDCCLENLPVKPKGWSKERYTSVFVSLDKKCTSSLVSLSDDELILADTVLYHYLFTAHPFDEPRDPPQYSEEAAALRTRIESLLSDVHPEDGSSR